MSDVRPNDLRSISRSREPRSKSVRKKKVYWCSCNEHCHGAPRRVSKAAYFRHKKEHAAASRQPQRNTQDAGCTSEYLKNKKTLESNGRMADNLPITSWSSEDERPTEVNIISRSVSPLYFQDTLFNEPVFMEESGQLDVGGGPSGSRESGLLDPFLSDEVDQLDADDVESEPTPPAVLEFNTDFQPAIPDLSTSMEFIRALRGAQLDNGDLSKAALERIREPPQNIVNVDDPNELFSLENFFATQNSPQSTYRDIRTAHNKRYPEDPMLSLEQMQARIAIWSGVEAIVHDMCLDSCVAFTGPYLDLDCCPVCAKSRYDEVQLEISNGDVKIPVRKFYTMPIGPQIQARWRNPAMAQQMMYRQQLTTKILHELLQNEELGTTVYEDIFHGSEYLNAVNSKEINETDVLLMFSMDGAQLYRIKESDCWIFIWVILELPPTLRYKKQHVIPAAIVPGPHNPKNMDSFMFPSFYHLSALAKEGLKIWNAMDNSLFTTNLRFYSFSADGPGSVHFTGLVGHHGFFPCRMFCGMKGRHKPYTPHYYPVLLLPNDYHVSGCDHSDVDIRAHRYSSAEDYMTKLQYLLESTSITNYKKRRRDTGICKPPLILGIPPTHRPAISSLFLMEVMHLTTLNLGDLLIPLWRGNFQCADSDSINNWDWAVLTDDIWIEHGQIVGASKQYLPNSYDRPPRNIAETLNSGYKAKEYQGYLYGLAPALLYNVLPLVYWRHFCKLVRAIRLISQRSIKYEQLIYAQNLMDEFVLEFELLYVCRRSDRIHFVRPCIHALSHSGLEVHRMGPIHLISAWTIERMIGDLSREIRQPSNPYSNLSERALQRSQINSLKSMIPSLMPQTKLPQGGLDIGNGYMLLRAREEIEITDHEAKLFREYIEEFDDTFLRDSCEESLHIKIAKWAWLSLPSGQIARTAWKECLKPPQTVRRARYVKMKTEGTVTSSLCYGEVQYFATLEIKGKLHCLALVLLFSEPDHFLLETSFETVHSVVPLPENSGLHIVGVKDILSVIAAIPHDFGTESGGNRYFIWEKLGLDVDVLSGTEEDISIDN